MRRVVLLVAVAACWTGAPPTPPPVTRLPVQHRSAPARVDVFDQSTPRAALASFIRAADDERYDVMLRFIPTRYREHLTEASLRKQKPELDGILAKVRPYLDDPFVEAGDTATLEYGGASQVKLVREDGVWRIADLD